MGLKIPGPSGREGSIPSRTNSTIEDPMLGEKYYENYLHELEKLLRDASEPVLSMCVAWYPRFGEPGNGSVSFVIGEISRAQKAYDALVKGGYIKPPGKESADE